VGQPSPAGVCLKVHVQCTVVPPRWTFQACFPNNANRLPQPIARVPSLHPWTCWCLSSFTPSPALGLGQIAANQQIRLKKSGAWSCVNGRASIRHFIVCRAGVVWLLLYLCTSLRGRGGQHGVRLNGVLLSESLPVLSRCPRPLALRSRTQFTPGPPCAPGTSFQPSM
jgi:hypothetical protein